MAAVADQVARSQIRDHSRRLDRHDTRLDDVGEELADLRVDFAKLLGVGLFAALILTVAANALIVHFLTPTGPPRPAVATSTEPSGR